MYLPTCVNLKEHGRKGGSGTQLYFEFTSSWCPHLCVFFKKFLFLNIWMYQEGDATPQIPLPFVLHESMRASLVDVSHWVCGAPLPPHIFLPRWKKNKNLALWLVSPSDNFIALQFCWADLAWTMGEGILPQTPLVCCLFVIPVKDTFYKIYLWLG